MIAITTSSSTSVNARGLCCVQDVLVQNDFMVTCSETRLGNIRSVRPRPVKSCDRFEAHEQIAIVRYGA
jgi:hypothetical protein